MESLFSPRERGEGAFFMKEKESDSFYPSFP
jgi:hypothetical protein